MSETDWASSGRWAAARLGNPSALHQSLKGSRKPVAWLAEVTNVFLIESAPGFFVQQFFASLLNWRLLFTLAYFILRGVLLRSWDSLSHLVIWWIKQHPKTMARLTGSMLSFPENLPHLQISRMPITLKIGTHNWWYHHHQRPLHFIWQTLQIEKNIASNVKSGGWIGRSGVSLGRAGNVLIRFSLWTQYHDHHHDQGSSRAALARRLKAVHTLHSVLGWHGPEVTVKTAFHYCFLILQDAVLCQVSINSNIWISQLSDVPTFSQESTRNLMVTRSCHPDLVDQMSDNWRVSVVWGWVHHQPLFSRRQKI